VLSLLEFDEVLAANPSDRFPEPVVRQAGLATGSPDARRDQWAGGETNAILEVVHDVGG
jgi:hypothetical protein